MKTTAYVDFSMIQNTSETSFFGYRATLEAKFLSGLSSIPVEGNSPLIEGRA